MQLITEIVFYMLSLGFGGQADNESGALTDNAGYADIATMG